MSIMRTNDGTGGAPDIGEPACRLSGPVITKRQLLLAAGALSALALATCGPLQQAAPPTTKQPKKVGFHHDWIEGPRNELIKLALEQWARENPTIQIDMMYYARGVGTRYLDQIVAAMSAGTEGDAALWEPASVELWAKRNAFADIKPTMAKLKYKLEDHLYLPDTITYQGKHFGMPFQISFQVAWTFNRTFFQRHQVPEPKEGWTWDDVIETAKKLTFLQQNQFGMWRSDDMWWHLPYELGGKLISDDRKKSLFDSPEGLAALELHWGLIHRHRIMPTLIEHNEKKLTWQNYGISRGSPTPKGLLKTAADNQVELDYAPIPVLKGSKRRVLTIFDQPHVVMAAAQRHNVLEEAARLILFMAGDHVGKRFFDLLPGQWPTRKALINSPEFLVTPPRNSKRLLDGLKLDVIPSYPLFPFTFPEWMGGWRPISNRMLNGELSPREAAQLMTIAGDAALAQAK